MTRSGWDPPDGKRMKEGIYYLLDDGVSLSHIQCLRHAAWGDPCLVLRRPAKLPSYKPSATERVRMNGSWPIVDPLRSTS